MLNSKQDQTLPTGDRERNTNEEVRASTETQKDRMTKMDRYRQGPELRVSSYNRKKQRMQSCSKRSREKNGQRQIRRKTNKELEHKERGRMQYCSKRKEKS